jgi:hypothetical protein
MAWIKRNLYFVITMVVGLGLAGYCGYLLYSTLDQNKADREKYFSDKGNLDTLRKKNPFPDEQNIQEAKADADRVGAFLDEFRKPFANFSVPPKLDDRRFKEYLQNSISQFTLQATNAGVGLPAGYAFSFSQQTSPLNYPSDSIAPWMQQLTEIRAILQILYKAKINYLQQIKRPAVSGEELAGDDYLQVLDKTNTWGVVTPYMVNFRGFSAEIANVLAGVAASSNCLIVKTIYVQPSREPLPQLADILPATPPPMQPRYQFRPAPEAPFNPYMQNNPGSGFRDRRREQRPQMQYPQMQFAPAAEAPEAPAGPVTILRETPLFVTLYIDVVKLKAPEPRVPEARPGPSGPSGRPSRRGGR